MLPLTNRQKEILQLITQGYLTKQIAEKLHISERTVRLYRQEIRQRLDAKTLFEAVAIACRRELT